MVRSKRGQRKLTNDIAKITLANATLRSSVDPAGRIDFVLIHAYGYILCAKVSDLPYLTVFQGLTGASRCNGSAYETSSLREIRPLNLLISELPGGISDRVGRITWRMERLVRGL